MNRESLKKSGLLEQYVLGLTNREETLVVERAMEEDAEIMEDYQQLRTELDSFIGANGMSAPDDGRKNRTPRDFEELDHEMVVAMAKRNHSLLAWRYALGAACLFLLCLSGYLFRVSENNRHDTLTEKAIHAQDNNNHDQVVKELEARNHKWSELKTTKVPADSGTVLVHFLSAQQLFLLDLSHLAPLPQGADYVLYLGDTGQDPAMVIPAGEEVGLREVALHDKEQVISIFRRPHTTSNSPPAPEHGHAVVSFSLAESNGL